jgi:putative transposase
VRFTTGTMRLEEDRRTITIPVIGGLRATENTRRVQRQVASGRAHVLNMTLSQRWGRLFVSIAYALRTPDTARTPARPMVRAGVDVGMRTPVVVQSGPRPHRYPGQPHRLVQALARTPDHPAPAEHP